jgi:hypothetical protein
MEDCDTLFFAQLTLMCEPAKSVLMQTLERHSTARSRGFTQIHMPTRLDLEDRGHKFKPVDLSERSF